VNKTRFLTLFILSNFFVGCQSIPPTKTIAPPAMTALPLAIQADLPVMAIIHGTLIDGTGANPVENGIVIIQSGKIIRVGTDLSIPKDATIIDAAHETILPGFINAHVHSGYDATNLQNWLQGGVTTVRDEGTGSLDYLKSGLPYRDRLAVNIKNARLLSAGVMIGVPGGYGQLAITTPNEARKAVNMELDLGADQIKVALEDGYGGQHDLPKLTPAELKAIVDTAHGRGVKVSGHITQAAYIPGLLDAGVDDIAHNAWDEIPEETIQRMVKQGVYLIPTFTIFRNYDAPIEPLIDNLHRFLQAGGLVALGNDFKGGPGEFDSGIPMYEIEMMSKAGMTPMQIIQAGTKNASVVVGLQDQIGTIEPGKDADIIIVDGNPLTDLKSLSRVEVVIHSGIVAYSAANNAQP
jgi:imidazolonepropionase-like amidohydrolase